MRSRIAVVCAACFGVGVFLSLILVGDAGRPPAANGAAGLIVALVAASALGALSARMAPGAVAIVVGVAAAWSMVAVALASKQLRVPDASLTGDGFGTLLLIYGVAGAVGSLVQLTLQRERRDEQSGVERT